MVIFLNDGTVKHVSSYFELHLIFVQFFEVDTLRTFRRLQYSLMLVLRYYWVSVRNNEKYIFKGKNSHKRVFFIIDIKWLFANVKKKILAHPRKRAGCLIVMIREEEEKEMKGRCCLSFGPHAFTFTSQVTEPFPVCPVESFCTLLRGISLRDCVKGKRTTKLWT